MGSFYLRLTIFFNFFIASYLQVEWKVRRKESESREFTKDNIKGSHPKVGCVDIGESLFTFFFSSAQGYRFLISQPRIK